MTRKTLRSLTLAVLISGGGRTLKNLLDLAEEGSLAGDVRLVISSSPAAAGLDFARDAGVPAIVCERKAYDSDAAYGAAIFDACRHARVDCVAMAGFLKFAPVPEDFSGRVINIHPSLIPSFCGHGMYGLRVHQAVLDYGAKVTGVTIHFVDNEYDHGPIIWQQPTPVFDDDTAETLAARVFELEKEAYPRVINLLAAGSIEAQGRRVTIRPSKRGGAGSDDID